MHDKDWYKNCGDMIREEFGRDADLFIDLLAATSPRKYILANWRLAMRIYHVWLTETNRINTHNLVKNTLPCHRRNIFRALLRKPLHGQKVKAFASNLKGDLQQVTIDVWVCRYYGIKKLTPKKYKQLAKQIKLEANLRGLEPAEWQAIIWHKAIKQANRKPKSYFSVPDKNQMFFEFYWN